ncbi:hypothetical protein BDP55DRAFT_644342 [Colletotrichum godetiae]|uniref:Uncharacterized protein n=1 Tax=Colletotrichum godetiae TaxID=1209918 RepID=A0AAJ0AY76_9PEZI|nr:uncharacterized protein BDP55DRAFT_644342 [Colletotrichum godetiae]KAK1699665.1 hypothetical protein BDP55DRAFT_644342 [Colletotrichum godetiae]
MKPRYTNGPGFQKAGRVCLSYRPYLTKDSNSNYHLSLSLTRRILTHGREKVSCTFGFTAFQAAPVERASWPGVPIHTHTHTRTPAVALSSQVPTRPTMHRGSVRALGMTASLAVP